MQNIQDVWVRIEGTKKQQKEIAHMYKDTLTNMPDYQKIKDQIKELSNKKKQLELEAQEELGSQYEKLFVLKKDLELDKQLLTDLALNSMIDGHGVKITDTENNEYEPIFSVRFKKTREVAKEHSSNK